MYSGETADQVVRMSLQGIQVAAELAMKAGGSATQSIAAALYAVITDQKKVKGKTRLETLMKTGKELKVFAFKQDDLKHFCEEAKRYGVLYCVLTNKHNKSGVCEIMVKADDASKISRIIDKLEIACIDTKAIKESIMINKENHTDIKPMNQEDREQIYKTTMGFPKEHNQEKHQSEKNLTGLKNDRPSVKQQLNKIKKELSQQDKPKIKTRVKKRNKKRVK